MGSLECQLPCYSGPAWSKGIGACHDGRPDCSNGELVCVDEQQPTPEVCDGLDNDCNGRVDDLSAIAVLGSRCGSTFGECRTGHLLCFDGELECVGAKDPTVEICDGLDNNCNGITDDLLPTLCYDGPAASLLDPRCRPGHTECIGQRVVCVGQRVPTKASLDIVILVDTSGSLSLLRAGIIQAIDTISQGLPESTHFALVSFPGPASVAVVSQDFVPYQELELALIQGVGVLEGSWDAMYEVATEELELSWRPSTTAMQIVWADEDGQSYRVPRLTELDVLDAVASAEHQVFIFTSDRTRARESYDDIARGSGGQLFILGAPGDMASSMLDEIGGRCW